MSRVEIEGYGPYTEADLPEDRFVELLEGTIIVNALPSGMHQVIVKALEEIVPVPEGYRRFPGGVRIAGERPSMLVPDIMVVRWSDAVLEMKEAVFEPEDVHLVAEVESPSSRTFDQGPKMQLYAEAKIKKYWLARPAERRGEYTVEMYVLQDEGQYRLGATSNGQIGAPS